MDKQSRALFDAAILNEACIRFGIHPNQAQLLDGFENQLFECSRQNGPVILRIAHSLHRSPSQTEAELDWLRHLKAHQVRVAGPLASERGAWVEVLPARDGSCFSAACFEKAAGRHPRRADWTPELFEQMGRLMGHMHRLARTYTPQAARPHWHAEQINFAARYLPPGNQAVIEQHNQLLEHLLALPTTPEQYGLIHQDMHSGNFFIHEGQITLFDFDDCAYGAYAYDIAMALFYILPHHCTAQEIPLARNFLQPFLQGYHLENDLPLNCLAHIPAFLKLREIDLYVAIHRSLDLNDLDAWCASFMDGRKEHIEAGLPYLVTEEEFLQQVVI